MYVPLLAILVTLIVGAALPQDAHAVPGTLRIEIDGPGRVTGPGVDCTSTCSVFANAGRPLKAIEQAGSGHRFAGWTGCREGTGGTSPDCFVDSYAPLVIVNVRFRDTDAPTVTLEEPEPDRPRRGIVGLSATAADNAGVAGVEFRVAGTSAGSDASAPFALSFDTTQVPDGLAAVEAVASDAAGNAGRQARTLTIDNTAPALAVSGPADRSFAPGTELTWTLSAGDANGIASAQCGVVAATTMPSFGACSGPELSHSARIEAPGNYAFFARVTDQAGNVTVSRPLMFTIEPAPIAGPAPAPAPVTRTFLPVVRHRFRTVGTRTRFTMLRVANVPAGSRVELSCRGRGCAFARKRFAARDGKVALRRALRERALRPGARLRVRIAGPAGERKVVTFTVRRARAPRRTCTPASACA